MVEGDAMRDARRQADRRLALPTGQDAGGQLFGGLIGDQQCGEPRGCRFGILSGVLEDEDLSGLGQGVPHQGGRLILSPCQGGLAVGEHQPLIADDPLPQLDGAPVATDHIRFQPGSHLPGIGHSGGKSYDLQSRVTMSQLGDGHLQGGAASRIIEQVDLVHYQDGEVSDPGGPISHQGVRLLRCGDYDLISAQPLVLLVQVSRADANGHAQLFELLEGIVLLRGQGPEGNDIERPAPG